MVDGSTNTTNLSIGQTAWGALELFQAALPSEFFERQRKATGQPREKGIYTAAVGALNRVLPKRKRIAEGTLSGNTGAFSRARCRLPKLMVDMAADQVVQYLLAGRQEALPGLGRQGFLLDGSCIDLPHTPELVETYPPASNQLGASHWPTIRVLVAHDLVSGIALRPVYGSLAVSEQSLAEQIIDRLQRTVFDHLDKTKGQLLLGCRIRQALLFRQEAFVEDAPPKYNYPALAGPACRGFANLAAFHTAVQRKPRKR
jgi:hypothetical protein